MNVSDEAIMAAVDKLAGKALFLSSDEMRLALEAAKPVMLGDLANLAREVESTTEVMAERDRLLEREKHFAKALGVADGGQYRNDWDAAIERVVAERDALRAQLEATGNAPTPGSVLDRTVTIVLHYRDVWWAAPDALRAANDAATELAASASYQRARVTLDAETVKPGQSRLGRELANARGRCDVLRADVEALTSFGAEMQAERDAARADVDALLGAIAKVEGIPTIGSRLRPLYDLANEIAKRVGMRASETAEKRGDAL